ncbi:MAG: hypothetical protein NZM35_03870 [Chitinophagales bacterium]|nr:hypothetical protein [Chitinophagales bacterium]MDW8418734.1 hypothetical protein [Chitinophagales bacterium]
MMRKLLIFFSAPLIIFAAGCARCYDCKQHCTYCEKGNLAYKLCAKNSSGYTSVDSFFIVLKDSGYVCNMLKDDRTICDGKNHIDEAVSFYQKQEYFCLPRE